jgi:hypothetical protein
MFEIIPGLMFWTTLILCVVLSYSHPVWVAVFIVLFDFYWLLKAMNSALHLLSAYKVYRYFLRIDWQDYISRLTNFDTYGDFLQNRLLIEKNTTGITYIKKELKNLSKLKSLNRTGKNYRDLYHIVLYPFVDESFDVLDTSLGSLSRVAYERDRIIVLLASEERAGEKAAKTAAEVQAKYGNDFFKFFISVHPDGLEGEIKGKSANASWAVQSILPELTALGIDVDNVLVSNFDSDTTVNPQYFGRVAYEFITAEKPYRSSYQPIAIYNNNIWDSPALIRLISINNTFFQFIESSRPNRLRTFSSHTMTLRALIDVGFWRKDLINEDGYIFWQCYLKYDGDYRSIPLLMSISLDTCMADSLFQTLINQYKQKRRWAYNVEYYPTLVPGLIKSKANFWDRMQKLYIFVEGDYNWAAAPIIISVLGFLPLYIGGNNFGHTVISANLPLATRLLMGVATTFLIFSVYINMVLLPPRPAKYGKWRTVQMYLQWALVPFISIIFGALPAVDAHTRLMLGQYMEFWVTPKHRTGEQTGENYFKNIVSNEMAASTTIKH